MRPLRQGVGATTTGAGTTTTGDEGCTVTRGAGVRSSVQEKHPVDIKQEDTAISKTNHRRSMDLTSPELIDTGSSPSNALLQSAGSSPFRHARQHRMAQIATTWSVERSRPGTSRAGVLIIVYCTGSPSDKNRVPLLIKKEVAVQTPWVFCFHMILEYWS
jgi:hypothetical protein